MNEKQSSDVDRLEIAEKERFESELGTLRLIKRNFPVLTHAFFKVYDFGSYRPSVDWISTEAGNKVLTLNLPGEVFRLVSAYRAGNGNLVFVPKMVSLILKGFVLKIGHSLSSPASPFKRKGVSLS